MENNNNTSTLKQEVLKELTHNILPYWMERMQDPRGGYYGQRDGLDQIDAQAPKGAILNARILWTFASAYRIASSENHKALFSDSQRDSYLQHALRAKDTILKHFYDTEFGGIYWSLDSGLNPLDSKKQFYAIAFAVYGLAELYRACSDKEALSYAQKMFYIIEDHSFDKIQNGYIEACDREWNPLQDMRLSEKDQNDAKTMNTHLHILEAYTNLYRVWKDDTLRRQLKNLIQIFLDKIVGQDGHLQLFFDESWKLNSNIQSFGHDIEASWLIWEAAEVLGNEGIKNSCRPICALIAKASLEGYCKGTGMAYEWDKNSGHLDLDRHWWVQAETVVGCYNQYQLSKDPKWLETCLDCWSFTKDKIICPEGEWYWSVKARQNKGNNFKEIIQFSQLLGPNTTDPRAGFWKCPYHNGRMCMELIERI